MKKCDDCGVYYNPTELENRYCDVCSVERLFEPEKINRRDLLPKRDKHSNKEWNKLSDESLKRILDKQK